MRTIKYLMMALAALTAQLTFAAIPVAVWDGDFKTTSKAVGNDTYTLAVNGNTVADDETGSSITIADTERKGVYINWTQTDADNTLLIRYSNLTLPSNASYPIGIVGFSTSSSVNNDGLAIHSNNGEAKAYWKNTYFYTRKSGVNMNVGGSEAKLALKYNTTIGTYARTNQSGSWETLYAHDGVKGQGTYSQNGAVVGGTRAATIISNGVTYDFQVATGMKILGIALFQGAVTDEDIAGFYFPSEYVAKIGENGYGTLASAITAAGSNETTITLVKSVSENVTIPANVTIETTKTNTLTGTIDGAGTIVYDAENTAAAPTFTAANTWTGTAWFKNFGVQSDYKGTTIYNDNGSFLANVNKAGSKIKLTGVGAYYTGDELVAEIVLEDGEGARAFGWENDSGASNGATIVDKMSGSGTYKDVHAACSQKILIKDISGFTGAFAITGKKVTLGGTAYQADGAGQICIANDSTVEISSGKTWTTGAGGIKINGELIARGNISNAVKGSGTLTFFGIPTNATVLESLRAAAWSGTMQLKDINNATPAGGFNLNNYGHADSKVQLTNTKLWVKTNTTYTPELVIEGFEITGTSNASYVFNKVSGTGKFYVHSPNGDSCSIRIVDGTNFTGDIQTERPIYFGSSTEGVSNAGSGKIVINTGASHSITSGTTWTVPEVIVKGVLNVAADATMSGLIKLGHKDATIVAKKELNVTCDVSGYEAHTEVDEEFATWTYTAIKPAIDHPVTTEVSNTLSIDGISIVANGVQTLAGVGGVQIGALSMTDGAKIVLDPIRTPIKLATKPMIAAGAKIALSGYSTCALGKFTLMTWSGDAIDVPSDLFDETSVSGTAVVICEEAPETGCHQLTLKVGNYDAEAAEIRIMPLGDSITEGTSGDGFARPNYRHYLMAKLEANGYKAISCGYQRSAETFDGMGAVIANSAGVVVPLAHQWHCGMSGQQCRTTGAAGWEDSIDVALDSAGYPDIVTFKIGTNDIKGSDYTRAKFITAWKNVINRILVARPNVKVIVGTIVDPSGDATETRAVNEEMKAAVADGESFPANRVYVADLNAACPRYSGSVNNFKDGLHPNWIGHDKTSDCYLEKILAIADSLEVPTKVINTKHGATNNIPNAYRKGFVKIATITPTPTWKLSQGIDSIVSVEDGMDEVSFDRVGYYMELQRKDMAGTDSYQGHVRYVWADMDAFGDKNLASFGISSTMAKRQQVVNNLHVYSNDTGIRKVEPTITTAKGFIEFCKAGFGTAAGSSEAGAPGQRLGYDWNDTLNAGDSGYGCFQIHRAFAANESWNEGEVLMAFNRWTGDNVNEIGIGSFAQKIAGSGRQTIDYVYTAGLEKFASTAYETMSIEIWGQLPAVTIEIPAAPTGAEVEVTVDGVVVDASSGSIEAIPGFQVVVTYSAAEGYNMEDVVFTFKAGEENPINIDQVVPVAKNYVAQIGKDGQKYETLQAAINATEDGDTVYLIADTIETISTQFAAANITLHINEGVTLTGKEWYTIFNYQNTLTIEGKGAIVNAVNPSYSTAFYNQEGTLYVRGGTIEALKYIFQESSPVKTEVTGGKFNLNPRPWLANKYTTTKSSDNKYFVVEALTYVAKIDTTEYETLQGAIDAVTEGQLIELACSTTEEITFDKNFIVAIKSDGYNYGTITGAKGLWERWNGQYSNVALYVVISKSMEDLVEHLTANISKYPGNHGRFYIYEDWTLSKDVRIPTVNDLSQSIFPVQNTFVLDLNGHTLDQAPVKSTHGGYPTIVAGHNTKVTIKDSSKDQTGILCGIGWAVDVYDNPNTSVTLESGTITTHGAEKKDSVDYHGRVIRLNGGSFIMNGGRITLEHLVEGNKIFGVITANTAVASTPHIEINGGYVQCATKDQLVSTNDPNCLIGGSKGPDSEVEITGGSFSIMPPKTYFAEGLDAVVDENGHFHVQQVVHEGEEVTIAVSDDGEKLAPAVPEAGSVEIIAPDETKVYVIDVAKQEAPAALYTVVTKDAEGEVVSTSNIGVVKVQEAVDVKNTIAVAVPFTGATVENLVNTKLLNEGDELKAYINGAYAMWSLDENGKWVSKQTVRAGGTETAPNAETTPLKRGTAVWVTTAGQVVTLGTFDAEEDIATADESVNLLANPTMEAFEPAITAETVIGDQVVETGVDHVRYTVVEQGGAKTWRCSTTIRKNVDGEVIDSEKIETKAPSIRVGRGYWMMKKSQKTK